MAHSSYVQVPPDGAGKKLHTLEHTVGSSSFHTQIVHLTDHENPDFVQHVDARGQAYTRFAEGSPSLDAFGSLRISEATFCGGYEYTNGTMEDLFTDLSASGGAIETLTGSSYVVCRVSAASASHVSRTTNRYHYYQPGNGTLVMQTVFLGDSGKSGNVRRWGFFDDNDGVFFELSGTNVNVVLRSSTTGVPVETRVSQSSWNEDKLNGTGRSAMSLDVTKGNLYWIDIAWLGVGAVRCGVFDSEGSRWVAHTFTNPNTGVGPYMKTATLPVRFENLNLTATSGISELNNICAAVYTESEINYTYWRFSDIENLTPKAVTTDTPILSARIAPGTRVGMYPESLNVYVSGANVQLSIVDDCVLSGATWTLTGSGVVQGDIGATSMTGGERFRSFYAAPGVVNIPLADIYEVTDEGYHRLADDSDSYTFTLVATKLDGTSAHVAATLNYKELR